MPASRNAKSRAYMQPDRDFGCELTPALARLAEAIDAVQAALRTLRGGGA